MEWKELLCPQRNRSYIGKSKTNPALESRDLRSEFEKDYHRIIGSASFRRLQDKTQVFPLDKSDFIRTRLTHSMEVSSFAKSLGQNISQYLLDNKNKYPSFTEQMKADVCDILQCAGLIHDIGNPPFGHFGETAIREWFVKNLPVLEYNGIKIEDFLEEQMCQDFYHFEGNAQAFRLVTKLHYLVDENGMNLTYGLLNTIVKYPVPSTKIDKKSGNIKDKKMGYFYADAQLFEKIQAATGTKGARHPLTFILEAADDIAYKTADIEDAYKKGCITLNQLFHELKSYRVSATKAEENYFDPIQNLKHQYDKGLENGVANPELYAVQNWVVRVQSYLIKCATYGFTSNYGAIMAGTYQYDLFHDTYAERLMYALGDIAYRYAFISAPIYKLEIAAGTILNDLLDKFINAAIYYDTDKTLGTVDEKLMAIVSENYIHNYYYYAKDKSEQEKLYLRLMLVTDSVCGMTDSYAKALYQELNGIS